MVPHSEDPEEMGETSEASQQPSNRLQQEQRKELASLEQQAAPDTEMDEKRQAALMNSLEQGETGAAALGGTAQCAVSAKAVQQLKDLLLLPVAEVEAALQQAEGNHLKATQLLLEQEL
ncbi:uncharacterized protein LOC34623532 [Cyclospora cayetanensis]|uniref:Uncharacterized protein LOC34623532 n=2 Tax=Cyclospora cayetanensis TaxID=88456 RepID=A0A6P5WCM8_9EIME|nr:uncharacterized protein LOC34623532 [Cyclospora cayetanensis]OEH75079.1 hypothetical protein cyc_07595 [Cyclospora cayetanensis]